MVHNLIRQLQPSTLTHARKLSRNETTAFGEEFQHVPLEALGKYHIKAACSRSSRLTRVRLSIIAGAWSVPLRLWLRFLQVANKIRCCLPTHNTCFAVALPTQNWGVGQKQPLVPQLP